MRYPYLGCVNTSKMKFPCLITIFCKTFLLKSIKSHYQLFGITNLRNELNKQTQKVWKTLLINQMRAIIFSKEMQLKNARSVFVLYYKILSCCYDIYCLYKIQIGMHVDHCTSVQLSTVSVHISLLLQGIYISWRYEQAILHTCSSTKLAKLSNLRLFFLLLFL